jgi:hypothetical protein
MYVRFWLYDDYNKINTHQIYGRNCFVNFQSLCNLFSSLVKFILIYIRMQYENEDAQV